MHAGYSWSGHERKTAYLNLTDGTFVHASAVSGADFDDDGRAVAITDWDGDGDLDMWLKNRSGPQLRYMENQSPPGRHYLELAMRGTTGNRDAVGTVVEVHAGDRKWMRFVAAGDGYLSQSSKRLHFGLGGVDRIDHLLIRWPGGETETVTGLTVDRRYAYVQGSGQAEELPKLLVRESRPPLTPSGVKGLSPPPRNMAADPEPPSGQAVVLRTALPLPPSILAFVGVGRDEATSGKERASRAAGEPARLICFWASWCVPCAAELSNLAKDSARLRETGLQILAVNIDKPEDRPKAAAIWQQVVTAGGADTNIKTLEASEGFQATVDALHVHVLDRAGWPLPMSWLTDRDGNLQIVYVGPVNVASLSKDLGRLAGETAKSTVRSQFPGRWYFRIGRDFNELAGDLADRGRAEDAAYYRALHTQSRTE